VLLRTVCIQDSLYLRARGHARDSLLQSPRKFGKSCHSPQRNSGPLSCRRRSAHRRTSAPRVCRGLVEGLQHPVTDGSKSNRSGLIGLNDSGIGRATVLATTDRTNARSDKRPRVRSWGISAVTPPVATSALREKVNLQVSRPYASVQRTRDNSDNEPSMRAYSTLASLLLSFVLCHTKNALMWPSKRALTFKLLWLTKRPKSDRIFMSLNTTA
jgi:hypothetical protein